MIKAISDADPELLVKVKQGDQRAFKACFNQYYAELTGFALKWMKDQDNAEEVVQDVFVRFWEQRETIEIQYSLKAYLYRSVQHACLNQFKHEKVKDKHRQYTLQVTSEAENSDYMEVLELNEKIQNTIDELPDRCRQVFLLSRNNGLKYSEIAEKLDISIKTVENQMGKALKTLRQNLTEFLPVFWVIIEILKIT